MKASIQELRLGNKKFVVVEKNYFERLRTQAGERTEGDLPPLPEPDAEGNFPAVAYARASIARSLIRDRRAAGLSQQQLAKLAGVRQETISRIESGKHTATVRVIDKLDQAVRKAATTHKRRRAG